MTQPINVALLVHSCDRYELLYHGFHFFFRQHWDQRIPCKAYFATEEKEVRIDGFDNIHSGKGEWADRLAYLLREKIKEEYILYFQEDMWLESQVNANFFIQLFSLAEAKQWKQVKLHSSEVYKTTPTGQFIDGFSIANLNNAQSDFLMSHQVTLWQKDFLLQQLHKREHPWRNERKATKRLKKLNPEIIHIDYFAENGKPPINENRNPVLRSSYQTVSVNGMLNSHVVPFIEKLQQGGEKDRQYAETLTRHFQQQLTHDGKTRPRKDDIFKRIKNKLLGK